MEFNTGQLFLGILAFATIFTVVLWRVKTVRTHSSKESGLWRGWMTVNDPEYSNRGVDLHLEVVYGKRARTSGLGFRIHLGDKYSETPLDLSLQLYFVSFFVDLRTPKLGRFFGWLGRGHKRDISLRTHGGSIWWTLWYCDDMGYDAYHNCDKWRNPWWWPIRTKHYRPWMCLRDGSIPWNPMDALFGGKYYGYETLEEDTLLIEINDFEGDEYMVDFKVQDVTRARRRGPKFLRKPKHVNYAAEWDCKEGIPTQNHDWKGDNTYGSSVRIEDPTDWRLDADDNLKAWVRAERVKRSYRPPVGQVLDIFEDENGLNVTARISDPETWKALTQGMVGGFSIASEAGKKVAESFKDFAEKFADTPTYQEVLFEQPDDEETVGGEIVFAVPLDGKVEGLSIVDNEAIKAMYTPEELAQQAINRDSR